MKPTACLFALTALVALPVLAQTSSSSSSAPPHFAPALPPPGINDPGVDPGSVPATASSVPSASTPAEITHTHLPGKPIPLPNGEHASDATPDVSVHQEGENTVQEYRQDGQVYMVVITPKHGLAQTYMVDHNGHYMDPNGAPTIKPVQYKVMQWGGSKPASSSSTEDADGSQ